MERWRGRGGGFALIVKYGEHLKFYDRLALNIVSMNTMWPKVST